MTIPPEITELVERLNQEINELERTTTKSLSIARQILDNFPDNQILIQMFAFLNSVLFLIETERQRIQRIIDSISLSENITNEQIQLGGQDLSYKLGRLIDTKLRVNDIKQRLENLQ